MKVALTDSVAHVEEPPRMPTVDRPSSEVWLPNYSEPQLNSTEHYPSVSGWGHLLTLTAAALRYSLTPQTPEDQTTSKQTV